MDAIAMFLNNEVKEFSREREGGLLHAKIAAYIVPKPNAEQVHNLKHIAT